MEGLGTIVVENIDRVVLRLRSGITGPATLKYRLEDEMIFATVLGRKVRFLGRRFKGWNFNMAQLTKSTLCRLDWHEFQISFLPLVGRKLRATNGYNHCSSQ